MNRTIDTDIYGILDMPAIAREKFAPLAHTKRALYVSTRSIAKLFKPSSFDKRVWITDDIDELMRIISQHGKLGPRKAEGRYGGLEDDPLRQQIILYTVVLDRDLQHILYYRRADTTTMPKGPQAEIGDQRLWGRGSIGFGGHIEQVDQFQWKVLSMLIPGFYQQIRKTLSLEVARIREFEEELGVTSPDLTNFFLSKAFRMVYTKEEMAAAETVPVNAVHTCICAVAVLDTHKLAAENRPLVFQRSEIASLEWLPVDTTPSFIADAPTRGETVEDWSQFAVHFVPEMVNEARRLSRLKTA